ncbi:MAG: DegT/DnrJ/EryC1/StrS aminotransferase family protein [Cyanobacteria bacterium SZAS TMP-1]|nr:DegT/DnrJ/EryC1/StrS aminotransferase family protein [Cyanobacteria bacterium SZAS TMP-1]
MKPASSSKRLKRAKAAAKSAKALNLARNKKSSGGKGPTAPKTSAAQTNRPAVEGTIAHARPTMGRQELQAAMQLIRDGALDAGPEVEALESEFCKFYGLPEGHAVVLASGAAALYLALKALDAQGKTVVLPAYGEAHLTEATRLAGGKAIYVDVADEEVHMDLEAATASGAELAVVAHLFGLPVDVSALKNMTVIEDCSDALGAKLGETYVGLQGDAAVFSLASENIITTGGQGGLFLSRRREICDKVRDYRQSLDLNITDSQAAIGRVQLSKLPNFLARREEIFAQYRAAGFELLDTAEGIDTPEDERTMTPVRYRAVLSLQDAPAIAAHLCNGMIEAIVPITEQELAARGGDFPRALELSKTTVSIPIYPHLNNAEVFEIIEQVEVALDSD